jgi:putative ABC transport system permease protein
MTSFALAWRTAGRYRAQTVLAIVGVAVIGALLFDMLLLSRGLLLSFADLLDAAGYDVRVVGAAGMNVRTPIDDSDALIAAIRRLPQVDRVASIRLESVALRGPGRPADFTTLIGSTETGASMWTILHGDNLGTPAAAAERCPLVIGHTIAAVRHLVQGSTVSVTGQPSGVSSALPPVECRVIGVADFIFAGGGDYTVATSLDAFRTIDAVSRVPDAAIILVSSRAGITPADTARAVQGLRPGLRVYSNDDVVAQFNQNGFAYFRQISIVLSSVTMVFAFLLVATLLTVSINQRLGEIAALRALGIRRRRIASMLMWESTLLVGTGGVLAIPLGALLAQILDRILKQMPGLPDRLHFFVFEPRAVAIHAIVLLATAMAAAAYPIWLATRLPIASTLRREILG